MNKLKNQQQISTISNDTYSKEQIILQLVCTNDIETLKDIGIKRIDLNFLETLNEIEIDQKVSPLICAAYLGRFDIVKMILANPNIDVDLESQSIGYTPLAVACMSGNYEIIKLLIEAGAEVNKPTYMHQTPFLCCFARLEEESNVYENRKICLKMAELLLQSGADIDWIIEKNKGFTLLMQLCHNKMEMTQREMDTNFGLIQFLIENGANKNIQSLKGKNSFDLSQKNQNRENIQSYLQKAQQIYFWNKSQQKSLSSKMSSQDSEQDEKKQKNYMRYLSICKNN